MDTPVNKPLRPVEGNLLQVLFAKLKRLKEPLKQLNRERYGGLFSRICGLYEYLGEVQHAILLNPTAGDMAREKHISLELTQLLRAEEKFLRQKSRVQFIKERDNNSTYFFRKVNAIQSFNSVRMLHDLHGHKLESFDSISSELVRHFTEALGTVDQNVVPFSDELLKELVGVEISVDMRDLLVTPVTSKEIKEVLFAMNGNKVPGLDAYRASSRLA
ncbi:hypothetical protein V6N13_081454 [Hibiscus sabdariffa]